MKLTKTNSEDLRGVFFIVKGQYKHHTTPVFVNKATQSEQCLGGYNPTDPHTKEWYMVLDNIEFNCVACGGDFDTVKRGVYEAITTYKTKERYLHAQKRKQGNKVSAPMRCLYEHVYKEFGDYYEDTVEEQEDLAYSSGVFKTPLQRSKDIQKKLKVGKIKVEGREEKKEEKRKTPLHKKSVTHLTKRTPLKRLTTV